MLKLLKVSLFILWLEFISENKTDYKLIDIDLEPAIRMEVERTE